MGTGNSNRSMHWWTSRAVWATTTSDKRHAPQEDNRPKRPFPQHCSIPSTSFAPLCSAAAFREYTEAMERFSLPGYEVACGVVVELALAGAAADGRLMTRPTRSTISATAARIRKSQGEGR